MIERALTPGWPRRATSVVSDLKTYAEELANILPISRGDEVLVTRESEHPIVTSILRKDGQCRSLKLVCKRKYRLAHLMSESTDGWNDVELSLTCIEHNDTAFIIRPSFNDA
jgi:hypothetical protein